MMIGFRKSIIFAVTGDIDFIVEHFLDILGIIVVALIKDI